MEKQAGEAERLQTGDQWLQQGLDTRNQESSYDQEKPAQVGLGPGLQERENKLGPSNPNVCFLTVGTR